MQKSLIIKPEEVYKKIKAVDPLHNAKYQQKDGIAISNLFADINHDLLCFNEEANKAYVFDGAKWVIDIAGTRTSQMAKIFQRALLMYAFEQDNSDFLKVVQKYGDPAARKKLIEDARDRHVVRHEDFDAHPFLLNCKNGVLNLNTLELEPHRPGLYLSKQSKITYDPESSSPAFLKFIDEITKGDKEKARFIQTNLGYALTGENEQERFFVYYGSTTRNGKSTLLGTIQYMLGDYATTINPESLTQRTTQNGSGPSPDIAALDGIRFLQCPEPSKRMRLNVELVKNLTGGDEIRARYLHQEFFTFHPVFKMFMNTNYLPVVTDNTLFSSGRVYVVEFNRHFDEAEQDVKLKSKLRRSENLSGITNWLLEGLKIYREQGDKFIIPESVKKATDEYAKDSDKIKLFFDDRMIRTPNRNTSGKMVYDEYAEWCKDNGYGVDSKTNFFKDLRNRDYLSESGIVDGRSLYNVVKGYSISIENKGFRGE